MLLLSSGIASVVFMDCLMRAVLIILIVAGLWFELHNPGMGFPGLSAVVTAVIFFVSASPSVWDILLFVAGFILLFADVILTPRFGIVGILGIICTMAGLALSAAGTESFCNICETLQLPWYIPSLLLTAISAIVGCGLCLWLESHIGKGKSSYHKKAS